MGHLHEAAKAKGLTFINETVGVNARGHTDPDRDIPLGEFASRLALEVEKRV